MWPRATEGHTEPVNRTDRLYAIVEELRSSAPASRTARELAEVYEVSNRTIERDILALQEAGVPIWGTTGRRGGYSIDPTRTLPPVNFTPIEAMAIAMAVDDDRGPFAAAARAARNKMLAVMSADDREMTNALASRVRRFNRPDGAQAGPQVPMTVQRAIAEQLVVSIEYLDRSAASSLREVEPVGVVSLDEVWYLVAWCRLREDVRSFRLDRIQDAQLTGDSAPLRDPRRFMQSIPGLTENSDFMT